MISHILMRRADVEMAAAERAPGYLDAVLSVSRQVGEMLEISESNYAELRRRFTSPPKKLGRNFLAAINQETAAVLAGQPGLDGDIVTARLEVCAKCEFLRASAFGDRCSKCGCFVAAKARFRTQTCPLNRWSTADVPAKERL